MPQVASRVSGEQVVPEFWIDDIFSGPHGLINEMGRYNHPNGQYRNQFWIEDNARRAHFSLGIFGQHIYVDPDRRLVAVKLSSWPDFLSEEQNHLRHWMNGVNAVVAAQSV